MASVREYILQINTYMYVFIFFCEFVVMFRTVLCCNTHKFAVILEFIKGPFIYYVRTEGGRGYAHVL